MEEMTAFWSPRSPFRQSSAWPARAGAYLQTCVPCRPLRIISHGRHRFLRDERCCLSQVDGRSTADGQQQIAGMCSRCGHATVDIFDQRLTRNRRGADSLVPAS